MTSPSSKDKEKSKTKVNIKKDRIFILVMVIIVASLSFELMMTLHKFGINNVSNKGHLVILAFADIIAIVGAFWLIRSYRRTLRVLKKQLLDKENRDRINKENISNDNSNRS